MSKWELRVEEPDKAPRTVPCHAGLRVGRHPSNDLVLDDAKASAFHAKFAEGVDGGLAILDCGSTNKTLIESGPILSDGESYPIRCGLTLTIGRTTIVVSGGPQEGTGSAAELAFAEQSTLPGAVAEQARAAAEQARLAAEKIRSLEAEKAREAAAKEAAAKEAAAKEAAAKEAAAKEAAAKEAAAKEAAAKEAAAKEAAAKEAEAEEPRPAPSEPRTVFAHGVGQALAEAGAAAGLAEMAAFRVANARLIIATEAIRTRFDISGPNVVVGRSDDQEKGVHCRLSHDAVSSTHARIRFQGGRFFLHDLDSRNGTFLGPDRVMPDQPRELHPDTHVRFGTVDALWVADVGSGGNRVSVQSWHDALEILSAEDVVSASAMKRVSAEAASDSEHPGEALLLSGRVTVAQWCDAMAKAPFLSVMRQQSGGGAGLKVAVVALALLLVVLVVLFFWFPAVLGIGA